jgi:hypothetical protein
LEYHDEEFVVVETRAFRGGADNVENRRGNASAGTTGRVNRSIVRDAGVSDEKAQDNTRIISSDMYHQAG